MNLEDWEHCVCVAFWIDFKWEKVDRLQGTGWRQGERFSLSCSPPTPTVTPPFFLQVGRALLLQVDKSPIKRGRGGETGAGRKGRGRGTGGRREVRKSSDVAPPNIQWPDLLGRLQPCQYPGRESDFSPPSAATLFFLRPFPQRPPAAVVP